MFNCFTCEASVLKTKTTQQRQNKASDAFTVLGKSWIPIFYFTPLLSLSLSLCLSRSPWSSWVGQCPVLQVPDVSRGSVRHWAAGGNRAAKTQLFWSGQTAQDLSCWSSDPVCNQQVGVISLHYHQNKKTCWVTDVQCWCFSTDLSC